MRGKDILALVTFVSLIIFSYGQAATSSAAADICYGVMFDGGSSGTRVSVYSWPCRTISILPHVNIGEATPTSKLNPGISTFGTNIAGIDAYLKPLLDFATNNVPAAMKKYTPLMLGATAGMRLLPVDQQNAILKKVRSIFKVSGFDFANDSWARVITGQEEAAYMWLSVNYLLNNFSGDFDKTVATTEMGGASAQVCFRPKTVTVEDNSLPLRISVNSRQEVQFDIYAVSYLGYGNDMARNHITQELADRSQNNTIRHPCYLNGYSAPWDANKNYTIIGIGQVHACKELIKEYLDNSSADCEYEACAVNGQEAESWVSRQYIYAVGAFQNAVTYSGLTTYNVSQAVEASKTFCESNWQIQMTNPANSKNPYFPTQCFLELYSAYFMKDGVDIPKKNVIQTPATINGVIPSWTLAGVFYQIGLEGCKGDSPVCKISKQLFEQLEVKS